MHKLYAQPGWGSVLVEAQLAWYGLPFTTESTGDLFKSADARDKLARLNPIHQLPTLILPDGRLLTESAAITLHLADVTGSHDLVPAPGAAIRPDFLRWLVFLVANVYPSFTYADNAARFVPEGPARQAFADSVKSYRQQLWQQVEAAAGAPRFLGAELTALDIYVAAMTRWTPRRPWFVEHCPRLTAIATKLDTEPRLAAVWQRNWPTA